MIKVGFFADGKWGHNSFKILLKDNQVKIMFVVPRKDTNDNTLKNLCSENNIDYLYNQDINSDDFYETAKSYNCDLFVSMSFNQIFKKRIINLPKLKSINCHAGLLPFYRGRNVLNWVLINGEKKFGITVHFIDEGIDTGDIILQKVFEISINDTYMDLLNRSFEHCPVLLHQAIKQLINNTFKVTKQNDIDPNGFYCGGRINGDEFINWNQKSIEIHNFIRALHSPELYSKAYYKDTIITIKKSRFIENLPNYKGVPGQILVRTKNGFYVKTLDSYIEIFDIDSEKKINVGNRLN